MGCNPVTMVDPLGLLYFAPRENRPNIDIPNAGIHVFEDGTVAVFGANSIDLETRLLQADERFTGFMIEAFLREALGIGNRTVGENGTSNDGSSISGIGESEGSNEKDGGGAKSAPVGPFEKSEGSPNTSVKILIWDIEGGVDVGHVALKVGDTYYGYYPTR